MKRTLPGCNCDFLHIGSTFVGESEPHGQYNYVEEWRIVLIFAMLSVFVERLLVYDVQICVVMLPEERHQIVIRLHGKLAYHFFGSSALL